MSARKVSVRKSRHRHLLSGPEVKRWYDNVARGSIITADVYLRRLGLFCEKNNITPKRLVEMDKTSLTALALDNVTRLEAEGHAGSYIESIVKAVKSWLQHNVQPLRAYLLNSPLQRLHSLYNLFALPLNTSSAA